MESRFISDSDTVEFLMEQIGEHLDHLTYLLNEGLETDAEGLEELSREAVEDYCQKVEDLMDEWDTFKTHESNLKEIMARLQGCPDPRTTPSGTETNLSPEDSPLPGNQ